VTAKYHAENHKRSPLPSPTKCDRTKAKLIPLTVSL